MADRSVQCRMMGEKPDDPGNVGTNDGDVMDGERATPDLVHGAAGAGDRQPDWRRRRFTVACALGAAIAAIPFLWILWGSWQAPSFLRKLTYEANFYDIQTRAMLHGGLAIPKGSIGVEAFLHGDQPFGAHLMKPRATAAGAGNIAAELRPGIQELFQHLRPKLMSRGPSGHFHRLQIEASGFAQTAEHDRQQGGYFPARFALDRGGRFFSCCDSESSTGRAPQIFSFTSSRSALSWRKR